MTDAVDELTKSVPPATEAGGIAGTLSRLPARAARVLVVEDDDEMRALLDDVLKDEGYVVLDAADVLTAIIDLASERVDVVITDWKMPGSNGLDLVDSVRRWSDDLPVIMVTAFPTPDLRRRAFAAGVMGFLAKPFTNRDLVLHVRAALAATRGSSGGSSRTPPPFPDDTIPIC